MTRSPREKLAFTTLEGTPAGVNFRVGTPETSQDIITPNGQRLYVTNISSSDERLATVAKWGALPRAHDDLQPGRSALEIPQTMRPASAVLGALAAFPSEKDEVLSFMSSYVSSVKAENNGAVDISLTLGTVGVSRGNESMVVLPPHHLTDDPEMIEVWAGVLRQDMENILSGDQRREELVGGFIASLGIAGRT